MPIFTSRTLREEYVSSFFVTGGGGGSWGILRHGKLGTYVQRLRVERFQVTSGLFNVMTDIARRTILAAQAL
jgi:hypothetical protein